MPSLEYFLVSESISVDQGTNQVSLFNVLEDVQANAFPILLPHIAIVASWNVEQHEVGLEYQASLGIHLPGGSAHTQLSTMKPTGRRHRLFTRIVGLAIPGEGEMLCHIAVDGVHHASHRITVRRVDQMPSFSAPPSGSFTTH